MMWASFIVACGVAIFVSLMAWGAFYLIRRP